jgi:hypothetical protein
LDKHAWIEVNKDTSFKDMNITRRLGKSSADSALAKEIPFTANKMGVFRIGKKQIKEFRDENVFAEGAAEFHIRLVLTGDKLDIFKQSELAAEPSLNREDYNT